MHQQARAPGGCFFIAYAAVLIDARPAGVLAGCLLLQLLLVRLILLWLRISSNRHVTLFPCLELWLVHQQARAPGGCFFIAYAAVPIDARPAGVLAGCLLLQLLLVRLILIWGAGRGRGSASCLCQHQSGAQFGINHTIWLAISGAIWLAACTSHVESTPYL